MSNLSAGATGNGNSAGFQQQMNYNAYDNYGGQGGYVLSLILGHAGIAQAHYHAVGPAHSGYALHTDS